jgi:NTP pyrophosphatase (non-canonical NTP hydrolase)
MSNTDKLTEALIQFRNERDWEQFHNPKDLAIALSLEAGELLENFLWKQPQDADITKIKEELADVLAYALPVANLQYLFSANNHGYNLNFTHRCW